MEVRARRTYRSERGSALTGWPRTLGELLPRVCGDTAPEEFRPGTLTSGSAAAGNGANVAIEEDEVGEGRDAVVATCPG